MKEELKGDRAMVERSTLTRRIPAFGLLLSGLLLVSVGCANTNNRDEDTRGATLLILDSISDADGEVPIYSDVRTCTGEPPEETCTIVTDVATVNFRNEALAPGNTVGFYQDVQLYRYQVSYTRSDGRNTQGVDVPFAFDSVMSSTVPADGTLETGVIVVRSIAKRERPLIDLVGVWGEGTISTNTRLDFWGQDVAGNGHHVYGWVDIEFGDWANE